MKGLKVFYTQHRITGTYLILFPLLILLSLIYAVVVAFLKFFSSFNAFRSCVQVISVGNITLGGSGKTPLVEGLARQMFQEGHRVAVLLRGYKSSYRESSLGSLDYYVYGDEASMLRQNLPQTITVAIGKNRIQKAKGLEATGLFDTLILDDGFQQWRFKRDLDIVVIDATNPFGNGLLLPAGPLREGLSGLRRAHVLCLTRIDEATQEDIHKLKQLLKRINARATVCEAVHEPQYLYFLETERFLAEGKNMPLESLKDKEVCLCCGIANPNSFLRTVEKQGAKVVLKKFFDDHHVFDHKEMKAIQEACVGRGIHQMITTEKDFPRLSGVSVLFKDSGVDVLVLKIVFKIVNGLEALNERLRALHHS